MTVKAYLDRTMLTRLLACFVLITGLAAIGAPAHAAVRSVTSEQASPASVYQQTPTPDRCQCQLDQRGRSDPSDSATACRKRRPVVIYIPTVQFGADRAWE